MHRHSTNYCISFFTKIMKIEGQDGDASFKATHDSEKVIFVEWTRRPTNKDEIVTEIVASSLTIIGFQCGHECFHDIYCAHCCVLLLISRMFSRRYTIEKQHSFLPCRNGSDEIKSK